ncbi:kinase non-catalytic C-lobe domain-containing protein 1 [Bombina bombina]|uniref:kinase non-catalytic C-lobe domain-containing protein 1 n=1 Tax=Bombina bombina TaxID=8345 RepID=UPI00235AFECE|nr:kinase non-catalytic C-lobe domain-containing protein 1 [Bombina bombina]
MEETEEIDVPEFYEEAEEDDDDDEATKGFYDFEPLPTLLEDEENVSLADILSLRDNCLTEQDILAICLECCCSLKSISHSGIFQTLCITPDTLAFNANGNVCFMEQLSDDPEGAFVPPEFDLTGNTLEAHIYSLGATLKAAIEFVIEPELETPFCQDLNSLLDLMQQENPVDRPDIESVISLCEEKLNCSSSMVCRSLSSIGRRVLSIESVNAFQDGFDIHWKSRDKRDLNVQTTGKSSTIYSSVTDDLAIGSRPCIGHEINLLHEQGSENGWREIGIKLERPYQIQHSVDKNLMKNTGIKSKTSCLDSCERFVDREKLADEMTRLSLKKHRRNKPTSPTSSYEKCSFSQLSQCDEKVTLKSWPSMPNCLSPNSVEEDQVNSISTQMSQPKNVLCFVNSQMTDNTLFSSIPMQMNKNCDTICQEECQLQDTYDNNVTLVGHEKEHTLSTDKVNPPEIYATSEDLNGPTQIGVDRSTKTSEMLVATPVYKDMDISQPVDSPEPFADIGKDIDITSLNEDPKWISLKHLLIQYGKPLKEDELWALCHECLYTLQTYIDYPAILCLESVFIDQNGEVLFVAHQNEDPCDDFCVPPEFNEQKVGNEKSCIYGIAAILWSAAKFNFPPNHKLTLPKKLKRFLLHMAKRNADERPNLADALLICSNYLLHKGINSKDIWASISNCAHQSAQKTDAHLKDLPSEFTDDFSEPTSGFVPVLTNSKILAVKGPVPLKDERINLPSAFTSAASYFKPIILMQNEGICSNKHISESHYANPLEDEKEQGTKKEYISPNDTDENHTDEGTIRQFQHVTKIPSRIQDSKNWNLPISDCSLDQKGKKSPESSSISSNSSTLTSSPITNNYLLKQDPKTGTLQLVRVQLSVPEHALSIDGEHGTQNVQLVETITNNDINTYNLKNCEATTVLSTANSKDLHVKVNDIIPLAGSELNPKSEASQFFPDVKNCEKTAGKNMSQECQTRRTVCSPLQKVLQLIHDEFAFDGYLENGVEDLAMGEYIFALKGLQFSTFCGAVCEKFCDLYWDEQLLENLYFVISGKSLPSTRTSLTDSAHQHNHAQNTKKVQRRSRKYKKPGKMSTKEQILSDSEAMSTSTTRDNKAVEKDGRTEDSSCALVMNTTDPKMAISSTGHDFPIDELDVNDTMPDTTGKIHQLEESSFCTEADDHSLYKSFSDCNSYCISPDLIDDNEENSEDLFIMHRDYNPATSICPPDLYKCSPGWSSAFYGDELFDSDVQHYVSILGKNKKAENIHVKRLELEQQLMMETKNYRKTIKLYQKLLLKGKRSKGSEVKELIQKLKRHLEEMKSKVQFLELGKKLLQVSYAEQWGLGANILSAVAKLTPDHKIGEQSSDDESFLLIYNEKGQTNDNTSKNLLAGTPVGLMAHLYASNAVLDGYVQQFLYTFRYFCSQENLLQFLIERIHNNSPRDGRDSSSLENKIYHCSLVLLQTWIEECWRIDFFQNPDLLDKLEDLSKSQTLPKDEPGEYLMSLLQKVSSKRNTLTSPTFNSGDKKEDTKSLHSLYTKLSEDSISRKSFNWKISKGNGHNFPQQKDKQYTIVSALPRQCYPGFVEELSLNSIKAEENTTYSIHECTVQQIASQLTLLQEEVFQKCHPVHFLNSRALGLKDKSINLPKINHAMTVPVDASSLFVPNCTQDRYLLYMLQFAENVSTWVAAEIVTCHTAKLQVNMLTKFLLVAKLCYEQRNFATSVQILGGLENLIVRQLPAWKNLPSKVSEILEELKAVEVFLKSDSLCLMKGDRFRTLPTIPSAYVLAMHVQQLETGGFTMANGAFKWNKLRNIARVASQVHAFQEIPYSFTHEPELQFYLRQRITQFSDVDISVLAARNNTNFHHVQSEKHSRKIQDTLRKMKATFQ